MKTNLSIKMTDPKDYKEVDLHTYQGLIEKLIYLSCNIRLNIAFVVEELNK